MPERQLRHQLPILQPPIRLSPRSWLTLIAVQHRVPCSSSRCGLSRCSDERSMMADLSRCSAEASRFEALGACVRCKDGCASGAREKR